MPSSPYMTYMGIWVYRNMHGLKKVIGCTDVQSKCTQMYTHITFQEKLFPNCTIVQQYQFSKSLVFLKTRSILSIPPYFYKFLMPPKGTQPKGIKWQQITAFNIYSAVTESGIFGKKSKIADSGLARGPNPNCQKVCLILTLIITFIY